MIERAAIRQELAIKVPELVPLQEERARLKAERAVVGRLRAARAERLRVVEAYLEGIRGAIGNLSDRLREIARVVGE